MQKRAVIIYGPPGSGKGTQAELLAKIYGFVHFDTGRYIENFLRAPGWQKNLVLRRERKLFDTGKLLSPPWVLKIVSENLTRSIPGKPRSRTVLSFTNACWARMAWAGKGPA